MPSSNPDTISEEFKQLCVDHQIEMTIRSLPNPGDIYNAVRVLEFRSYSESVIRITQNNNKKTQHDIPAMGSIQMILKPGENLPNITRLE